MTLHLIKLAVGITDIDSLRERQARRLAEAGGRPIVHGFTRRKPRREAEITDGGSIYWVIRGSIQVRQRILGFEDALDDAGVPYCRIVFDPELVPTEPRPHRPMQGWRYIEPGEAPPDLARSVAEDLPADLRRQLIELGLW